MDTIYDLIIIGGGPAGLTAGIYAMRRELKTLVIAKALGGQAAMASEVQNWPGTESIAGFDLMQNFIDHAKQWKLESISNEVLKIEKSGGSYIVSTNKEKYQAAAVILAFGLTPRDLKVPGEEQLKGRGVAYCATCDGPLYKNKKVAVAGGGNAALEAAQYLATVASEVTLINSADKFFGDQVVLDAVSADQKIKILLGHEVKELRGDKKLSAVVFVDKKSGTETVLELDGIFVEVGYEPKTKWLEGTVKLNKNGEIVTDKECATSEAGIFAAGDCTDSHFKQIVISAGEGAKAALSAYKYIAGKKGIVARPDWGKH